MSTDEAFRTPVMNCRRCQAPLPLPISISAGMQPALQGLKLTCGTCGGITHVPDLSLSEIATVPTIDTQRVKSDFEALLDASRKANELYFLLAFSNWQDKHRTTSFMSEINRMTQGIVRPPPGEQSRTIGAESMLFVLQTNLEAKAFYSIWRNLINPLVPLEQRLVAPEPWTTNKEEMSLQKNGGRATLNTGKIVANIAADLRTAGFHWLGGEFEHTHSGTASLVRNAVAHSAFLTPESTGSDYWTFGEHYSPGPGRLAVREHFVSHHQLAQFFRRFLAFRFAAFDAFQGRGQSLKDLVFDFDGQNQMDRSEMLKCRWEKGVLSVKDLKTPLW